MSKHKNADNISAETWKAAYHGQLEENRILRAQISDTADQAALVFSSIDKVLGASAGYYRMGRNPVGVYWVRWKWTQGPYANHYVIGGHESTMLAAMECLEQVEKVDKGRRTPLIDGGYKK